MPYYVGFTTVNANKPKSTNLAAGVDGGTGSVTQPIIYGKKFVLVDEKLVITDFVNALNIRQGEKVGQPGYGSDVWSFIFEPNTADIQFQLENELRRIAQQDPRLILNTVNAYPFESGILVELEVAIAPLNNPQLLNVFFDQGLNKATIV